MKSPNPAYPVQEFSLGCVTAGSRLPQGKVVLFFVEGNFGRTSSSAGRASPPGEGRRFESCLVLQSSSILPRAHTSAGFHFNSSFVRENSTPGFNSPRIIFSAIFFSSVSCIALFIGLAPKAGSIPCLISKSIISSVIARIYPF